MNKLGMARRSHLLAPALITTFIAGALGTLAVRTMAADTPPDSVFICHAVTGSETSNARMTASSDTALECRAVSMKLKMSNGSMRTIGQVTAKSNSGPELSQALTPAQVNDAWIKWLDMQFNTEHGSLHP